MLMRVWALYGFTKRSKWFDLDLIKSLAQDADLIEVFAFCTCLFSSKLDELAHSRRTNCDTYPSPSCCGDLGICDSSSLDKTPALDTGRLSGPWLPRHAANARLDYPDQLV
jgi:hypothetical protein